MHVLYRTEHSPINVLGVTDMRTLTDIRTLPDVITLNGFYLKLRAEFQNVDEIKVNPGVLVLVGFLLPAQLPLLQFTVRSAICHVTS